MIDVQLSESVPGLVHPCARAFLQTSMLCVQHKLFIKAGNFCKIQQGLLHANECKMCGVVLLTSVEAHSSRVARQPPL